LVQDLDHAGLTYEIKGRPKSIHSILNKMNKQNVPFEEVYDLFAIRIIVDSPYEIEKSDCWKVYSVVTDHYMPNPDRLRDWVSTPKANGYESLHTTVMGPKGRWVEVQIRSKRMDEIAEKGFAAHWKYKDNAQAADNGLENWLMKVREILENPDANALEFLDDFKLALYTDEIFVFTPKGDLKKLPLDATVLDFAFEIHSDLGLRCIGAKLNNKLVPINHKLSNGDQVEILTSAKQNPSEDWMQFLVTAKAKARLRDFYKQLRISSSSKGKDKLENRFKQLHLPFTAEALQALIRHYAVKTATDLYYLVATEKINASTIDIAEILISDSLKLAEAAVASKVKASKTFANDAVILGENEKDMPYAFSDCCNPIPGDEIFGFVTIGEGVKIHRTNCSNALSLMSNYGYRIIKAKWADDSFNKGKAFLTSIKVAGIDSVGIVSIITDIISKQLKINMRSISISSNEGMFEGSVFLEVHDTQQLENIMKAIKAASPLISVSRVDLN